MTNFEKYKEEIIQMLVRGKECINLLKLSGCEDGCKGRICSKCECEIEHWLNEEVKEFEPSKLKVGDKIIVRKNWDCYCYAHEYEVLGNSLSVLWLRDNDNKEDDGFLITHNDILQHYIVEEVSR